MLPLLHTDLLTVMRAVTEERLDQIEVRFAPQHAACVIMASRGYPSSYEKGFEITIPDDLSDSVFVAGAAIKDGRPVTSGGRVLGVTALGDSLREAIDLAYAKVDRIHFDGAYWRTDIGARALKAYSKGE